MYVAPSFNATEQAEALLVRDRRGQPLNPAQREGEGLPIGELGSKAIFQVRAERFRPVTL